MNNIVSVIKKDEQPMAAPLRIGEYFVTIGKLTPMQVENILNAQQHRKTRFGETGVLLGILKDEDVKTALITQSSYQNLDVKSRFHQSLSTIYAPQSNTTEAFRSLRNELLFRFFEKSQHQALALFGMTSTMDVTWCSANLAIAFSQLGKNTLVIDANLRDPVMHNLFGIENKTGLSDYLVANVHPNPVSLDNTNRLNFLCAGNSVSNPQEILAGQMFKNLVNVFAQSYEIVLVNASPVSEVEDCMVVATHTGTALLVAREHKTLAKDALVFTNRLKSVDVDFVGSTLLS